MEEKQEPIPVYAGVYEEIAEIIGKERIEEFYERFKGQQFVFPMKLYSKEYVMQEISHLQGKKKISDMQKGLATASGMYGKCWRKPIRARCAWERKECR